MNGAPVRCANCGAMMSPGPDGRTYACAYCNARIQVAIDGGQIAAGMRADLADAERFLSSLANALAQGFAEHAVIHAQGRVVNALEVHLDPDKFFVRREGHHLVAQHQKVVRGIALRTATVPLDRWYELLCDALAQHANTNARAAWVLGQISGGGGGVGGGRG
jgi:hypothetical protein